jgi:plastocyanin
MTLIGALGVGCAPDRPDVYSAPDAPAATLPPLPTTTLAADGADAVITTFPANGTTVEVRSLDNSFIAAAIEIDAGTEVDWINGGRNDHNILPVDDSLEWGIGRGEFVPGSRYSYVFDQPGVFAYYCSIHGTKDVGMVGAIVVNDPS